MAVAATTLTSGAVGSVTTVTSASISPAAGSLLMIVMSTSRGGSSIIAMNPPTGLGLTWAEHISSPLNISSDGTRRGYAYTAQVPAGGVAPGTVTMSWDLATAQGFTYFIVQVTEHDPARPFAQYGTKSNQSPSVMPIPLPSATPSSTPTAADSRTLAAWLVNTATTVNSFGATMTSLGWLASVGATSVTAMAWSASQFEPNPTASFSGGGYKGGFSFEIVAVPPTMTAISASDTGTLTDAGQLTPRDADTAHSAEAATVSVTIDAADTGHVTGEIATYNVPASDQDYGYFDEGAVLRQLRLEAGDTATGAEGDPAIDATVTGDDQAQAADAAAAWVGWADADTMTSADAVAGLDGGSTPVSGADAGRAGEQAGVFELLRPVHGDDTARSKEAVVTVGGEENLLLSNDDTATTADDATLHTATTGADTATPTEGQSASDIAYQYLTGADTGRAADSHTGTGLADADTAASADDGFMSTPHDAGDDPVIAAEGEALVVASIGAADTGNATETWPTLYESTRVVSEFDRGRLRDSLLVALTPNANDSVIPMSTEDTSLVTEGATLATWEAFRALTDIEGWAAVETQSAYRPPINRFKEDYPTRPGTGIKANIITGVVAMSDYLSAGEYPINHPLPPEARAQLAAFRADPNPPAQYGDDREDTMFRYRYQRRWPTPDRPEIGWYIVGWQRPDPDSWLS